MASLRNHNSDCLELLDESSAEGKNFLFINYLFRPLSIYFISISIFLSILIYQDIFSSISWICICTFKDESFSFIFTLTKATFDAGLLEFTS